MKILAGIVVAAAVLAGCAGTPPVDPYAGIDNSAAIQTTLTLRQGAAARVEPLAKAIAANPGAYNPMELVMLGDRLVRDGKVEEGLFWFHAGRQRAAYDAARCNDVSLQEALMLLSMQTPAPLQEQFKDLKRLRRVLAKVETWEKTTPATYDPRWILPSGIRYYATKLAAEKGETLKDGSPILKPQTEWPALHAQVMADYQATMAANIKKIEAEGGWATYQKKQKARLKAILKKNHIKMPK